MTHPGPVRRWATRALLVLAGLAAGLALAEAGLRVLGIEPPGGEVRRLLNTPDAHVNFLLYPSNPHGEFVPAPRPAGPGYVLYRDTIPRRAAPLEELERTPFAVEDRTSSLDLRDREFSPVPPPGVVRILAVGDSFCRGEGVPLRRTFPKQLESLLGEGFEVVNVARPGADLEFEATEVPRFAAALGARRALLVLLPNDVSLTPELARRQDFVNDLVVRRWEQDGGGPRGGLRTAALLGACIRERRIERETLRWYADLWSEARNGANLRRFAARLRGIAALPSCRTAVVVYPLMHRFSADGPLAAAYRAIVAMAREAGLPALDLLESFRGRDPEDLQVHPIDHHPNGDAHRIAAEAVARWLRDEVPDFLTVR